MDANIVGWIIEYVSSQDMYDVLKPIVSYAQRESLKLQPIIRAKALRCAISNIIETVPKALPGPDVETFQNLVTLLRSYQELLKEVFTDAAAKELVFNDLELRFQTILAYIRHNHGDEFDPDEFKDLIVTMLPDQDDDSKFKSVLFQAATNQVFRARFEASNGPADAFPSVISYLDFTKNRLGCSFLTSVFQDCNADLYRPSSYPTDAIQNEYRETTTDAEKEKKNSASSLSSDLIHKAFSFTDEEWNSIKRQETEEIKIFIEKRKTAMKSMQENKKEQEQKNKNESKEADKQERKEEEDKPNTVETKKNPEKEVQDDSAAKRQREESSEQKAEIQSQNGNAAKGKKENATPPSKKPKSANSTKQNGFTKEEFDRLRGIILASKTDKLSAKELKEQHFPSRSEEEIIAASKVLKKNSTVSKLKTIARRHKTPQMKANKGAIQGFNKKISEATKVINTIIE